MLRVPRPTWTGELSYSLASLITFANHTAWDLFRAHGQRPFGEAWQAGEHRAGRARTRYATNATQRDKAGSIHGVGMLRAALNILPLGVLRLMVVQVVAPSLGACPGSLQDRDIQETENSKANSDHAGPDPPVI